MRDPKNRAARGQSYKTGSLILETVFPEFTVTDYLDCSLGRPMQRAGRSDLVRSIDGRGQAVLEFAPRIDFGRVPTRILPREGGLEVDWVDGLVLFSPGVDWAIER